MSFFYLLLTFWINAPKSTASPEGEFIKDHITEFHKIHYASLAFEKVLDDLDKKETALYFIDQYSLSIEEALDVYESYKNSDHELIKELSTHLEGLLTDILIQNYNLLGKLIKEDYDLNNLKKDYTELIEDNRTVSFYFRDVTFGILMLIVKERPENSDKDKQYSVLTLTERDKIIGLVIGEFGNNPGMKEPEYQSSTDFEYSCVTIFGFLNLIWEYEPE